MHLTSLEEYAVRCAVQLARLSPDAHLPASKIASLEGISLEYVSKIMFLFRQGGLVQSVRGVAGGFKLGKSPEEISLKEVLDTLTPSKKIGSDFCGQFKGQANECVHLGNCSIRPVWELLSVYIDQLVNSVSLGDLIKPEKSSRDTMQLLVHTKTKAFQDSLRSGA